MKDLALLVADKNMDFALRGILSRPKALGIRSVSYEIRQHVNRDGGVRTTGPETLALSTAVSTRDRNAGWKEALEQVLVPLDQPRSSALYEKITGRISIAQRVDPAYGRLRSTLQSWFAP
jgi:hypothetical protein